MELTANNVQTIAKDCLFRDGEDTTNHLIGDAIIVTIGFHPERLEAHREDIKSMLDQLHPNFRMSVKGGWTFLNMSTRADGTLWAEQPTCGVLVALANALGLMKFCLPRELWAALPGNVPYIVYMDKENAH